MVGAVGHFTWPMARTNFLGMGGGRGGGQGILQGSKIDSSCRSKRSQVQSPDCTLEP